MFVVVLSPFLLALVAPWLHRLAGRFTSWLLALLPLGIAGWLLTCMPDLMNQQVYSVSYPWVPSLNVPLAFYLDGLALVFALLISGIGALILIYAGGYMGSHPQLGRLYAYLLMFMGAMLGVVLANNVIVLYVFWELTSLASYLLIGFSHTQSAARQAALQALLVTASGGLALLAGLVMLAMAGHSWTISTLLLQGDAVRAHAFYMPILLLVALGAFTKSAQWPFHFWLPGAMAAPTPVSAYLHSATMVKAGVYLLARLSPVLGGTPSWHALVTTFGAITMLVGAYLAWQQTDLKRILAYSTVSALGTLVLLLGLGTPRAVYAAIVFLMVHSFYKAALFMAAGSIDHGTGSRDVEVLGGLRRYMPLTFVVGLLAAASMVGIPGFFGFVGKELAYETILHDSTYAALLGALAVLANALLFAAVGLVALKPFFGPLKETPHKPHEVPFSMALGPLVLGILGLSAGVAPGIVGQDFIDPAALAILQRVPDMHLKLWHGFNVVLVLSIVTAVAGVGLYVGRDMLRGVLRPFDLLMRIGPAAWYDLSLAGLNWLAPAVTGLFQTGKLRVYVLFILLTMTGLVVLILSEHLVWNDLIRESEVHIHELTLAALILAAAWFAVSTSSRLTAVLALGVVGYGVALFYVTFGAPDLAMTQFSIETLTVILFVLVLYRLPRFALLSDRPTRIRDAIVAIAGGTTMSLLVLAVTAHPVPSRLMPYFAENSLPEAKGRNIVNVILVDFRGLDTLGEILVLSLAAIGVYALLKLRLEDGGAS